MLDSSIQNILTQEDREEQFVDLVVHEKKEVLLTEIERMLGEHTEHTGLLLRWKARVLLQDAAAIRLDEWKFLLHEHLFESIFSNLDIVETIIEHLYFLAKTNVSGETDEIAVQYQYQEMRNLIRMEDQIIPFKIKDTPQTMGSFLLLLQKSKSDTLSYTEFVSTVQQQLAVVAAHVEIPEADQQQMVRFAMEVLFDTIDFLTGPRPDTIYPTVITLMEPEVFDGSNADANIYAVSAIYNEMSVYERLYYKILELFGDPALLDTEGITALFQFLADIAEETKQEEITTFVIYNEATGTFEFNESLLEESVPEDIDADTTKT